MPKAYGGKFWDKLMVGQEFWTGGRTVTVTIVDGPRRVVLGTLKVPPRPHGLAVVVQSP